MCLFTHFAAGALAGGATGSVPLGVAAGLASHAVLDMIPHYDHPDWRLELAGGLVGLALLLALPFASWPAVLGGLAGMLPDLENLLEKLGRLSRRKFIFPTHTGLLPHGRPLGPRTLGWQAVIFVACFGALGLVNPPPASAQFEGAGQPVLGPAQIQVLRSSADMTVVRVTVPCLQQPDSWSGADPERARWGDAKIFDQETGGNPRWLLPKVWLSLAVPTRREPQVTVLETLWWREPDGPWDQGDLVRSGPPRVHRSVPLAGAEIALAPRGGILAGVTLEIAHPAAGVDADHLALGSGPATEAKDTAFRAQAPVGLLNPAVFSALSSGARRAALAAAGSGAQKAFADLLALTGNWVQLPVKDTGLYRVTGQDLSDFGLPTTGVDPRKLRLFRGGGLALGQNPELTDAEQAERVGLTEVAIEVLDGGDQEWNLDDELRFYGFGSSAWRDRFDPQAERLDLYDHPFAAQATYWLTWADESTPSPLPGEPRRIGRWPGIPGGGETLASGRVRLHLEQQKIDAGGLVADGWTWNSYVSSSTSPMGFILRHPVPGTGARFVVDIRGNYGSLSTYPFSAGAYLNGDSAQRADLTFTVATQENPDSLRVRLVGQSSAIVPDTNTLTLENRSRSFGSGQIVVPKQDIALDSFDISYRAQLILTAGSGALEFILPPDEEWVPGGLFDLQIQVPGGEETLVWDVSDPASPADLGGAWSLSVPDLFVVGLAPGGPADRHLAAVRSPELLAVTGGRLVHPVDLRSMPTDLDHITIYAKPFELAAAQLASFRNTQLPGVAQPAAAKVLVDDIYNCFSGGQKDPLAIRNYLRFVYEQGGHRLGYVCFLGNASRDYRNYYGRPEFQGLYDFLPTVIRTVFPLFPTPLTRDAPYAADDAMVSFDLLDFGALDLPDLACGRLTASSPTEALDLVSRSILFDSQPEAGPWRNKVAFVADDASRPDTGTRPLLGEIRHTQQADDLVERYVPLSLDVQRIYGLDYPFPSPSSNVKPQMNNDLQAAMNAGATIVHYIGHGSEDNLADEQIFRSGTIPNLLNGMKRFVFIAFSCDVGVFDSPNTWSMAEQFLISENGGAIGAICASQVSYVEDNNQLSNAFYMQLYPERRVAVDQTMGAALNLAKGMLSNPGHIANSQRYTLFGDPALSLPNPGDDLGFAADSPDTLVAGQRQVVRLEDDGQGTSSGDPYDLRVEESDHDRLVVVYSVWTDISGNTIFTPSDFYYRISGASVFRGTGVQAGPRLEIPFINPVQFRYGDQARIRVLAETNSGQRTAVRRVHAVRGGATVSDDVWGPDIRLSFAEDRFRVRAGSELKAALEDSNGVAILGTSPGNSLLLEFDDTGFMTDVTAGFQFDANSYTVGRLVFPLPSDLALGKHRVALHASDALGNVGSDTLGFQLIPEGVRGVESVTLFPNPTAGPCRLLFELSDPMTVQWEIYTLAGRRLVSIREDFETAGPGILAWDGRDQRGDQIANGTYLFVLRGFASGPDQGDITKTGKLVVMR